MITSVLKKGDKMNKEKVVSIEAAYEAISQSLYASHGRALFTSFQDTLSGIDSIKGAMHMSEIEDHGLTFITRPKCNLTSSNLKSDRIMSMLDSLDPMTVAFATRAFVDSKFISIYKPPGGSGPFVDDNNPFIPLLSNRLVGLSGWPDPVLDVHNSNQGFFSESITYPNGWDQLTKNYDLTATFNDIQGSCILMIFLMWTRYLFLVTRGIMLAYMEDIEDRRMGFTSSIYRFILDPSKQFITKWAKATGCFPRSIPLGAYFNYDHNAAHVDTSMNMSIPFSVAGKIEYLDPIILHEFNTLVTRKNPRIDNFLVATQEERVVLNFKCIPYVQMGTNKLAWKYDNSDPEVRSRFEIISNKIGVDKSADASDPKTAIVKSLKLPANELPITREQAEELGIIGD